MISEDKAAIGNLCKVVLGGIAIMVLLVIVASLVA